MQRAFALYAALIDNRHPVSRELIEQRIYRREAADAKRSSDWFETSFKRDRVLLRELGIHVVHTVEGQREGYVIDRTTSFARDDFLFEIDEASCALLYLALTSLSDEPLFPLPMDLRLAQLRLAQLWQRVYGDDEIAAHINRSEEEAPDRQAHAAEVLLRAILQTRNVTLTYRNRTGTQKVRTLAPYGLSFFGDRWYVVGHDSISDAVRVFALSRIEELEPTKETFEHPEEFRISDYITLPFLLGEAPAQKSVALLIDKARVAQVPALTRGKGTVAAHSDDTLLWTVDYTDLDELVRYVVTHELRFENPCCHEAQYLREELRKVAEHG